MEHHPRIDDIDRQIIELLGQDARRTIADIASRVNLSAAPVKRRIDRLEQCGVITGYTVVVDHAKLGSAIEAFTELTVTGDADIEEVIGAVAELPEVWEVLTIAGDPDAVVRMQVDNVDHLRRAVGLLRRIANVTGTKTLIVLGRRARTVGSD